MASVTTIVDRRPRWFSKAFAITVSRPETFVLPGDSCCVNPMNASRWEADGHRYLWDHMQEQWWDGGAVRTTSKPYAKKRRT